MRPIRFVTVLATVLGAMIVTPLPAQRTQPAPDSATRAAIDEFVLMVRDMAAARVVTPAAHVPVGGLLDSLGHIASVTGSPPEPTYTPDSLLITFRRALGAGGRRQRSRAVAVGYLAHRTPPRGAGPVETVVVEVEHTSGYRVDVLFPFIRNEFGEPVFGASFTGAGSLHALDARRQHGAR